MSLTDQRRRSIAGQPSSSPLSSAFLQRTGGLSPTRRTSSRRLSSRSGDALRPLRRSTSRKISRNNPPHINNDIAKSQFAIMNSRPHTPVHQDSATTDSFTTLVNPTSTILQGLIKEQRATRGSRKTIPQMSEDVDHTPPTSQSQSQSQSQSPHNSPSEKQRRINNFASSGLKQPRDMGIREMDQYVSKMNKLNFDLKLDVFHRTQQIATLEKKMERMHIMEEELGRMRSLEDELDELREVEENNQRLREANEQLQSELDRRDQAISEAVELICQLESKIEGLQTSRFDSTTSLPGDGLTTFADDISEVCTPKAQTFVDIPDRTSSRKGTARRPRKSPSFLREETRGTAALRSLFMSEEDNSARSVSASTVATTTVDSMADPQSPRLSILSECSYFSPQDIHPKGNDFEQLDRLDQLTPIKNENTSVVLDTDDHLNDRLADRVSDWMQIDDHTSQSELSNSNRRRRRALSDISKSSQVPIIRLDEPFQPVPKTRRSRHPSPRESNLAEFGANLPPTPDTMSTFRPGLGNGSNASLLIDRRVETNITREPSPSALSRLSRPHSADEITTSMSVHSDGIDTAASIDTQYHLDNQDRVSGLLLSFSHFGRDSSNAAHVVGPGNSNSPKINSYGGDLLLNGEGVENVISGMHVSRTSSLKSNTAVKASHNPPSSVQLTPQEWLEAAKAEEEAIEIEEPDEKSKVEHSPLIESQTDDIKSKTAAEASTDDSTPSRNPPLRLQAWANHPQQAAPEVQPRRRLSLRPRFFTRNRQQDLQAEPVALNLKGPSPVPDKSLVVPKHRRTNSGPNFNSEDIGTTQDSSVADRASTRPLPKTLSELRPSTSARPVTSGCVEPRSRGSLLLGWMKGSHNKEPDVPSTGNLGFARSVTERPKSTASVNISTVELSRDGDLVTSPSNDEPILRARRRSRRMA